jgi:hypothetical protein
VLNDEVKNRKSDNRIFDRIFELLLLAVGSLLAYGFIFSYEWGFASVFSIPPSFISIDLITFAMRFGIFIPSLIFVFYFYWHFSSILVVLRIKKFKVYGQFLLLTPLFGLFGYSVYLVFNSNLRLSDYVIFGIIILISMWQFWLTFMLLPGTIKNISDHKYLKSNNKIGLSYVVATWENKIKESRGFSNKLKREEVWNKLKENIDSFSLYLSKIDSKIVFICLVVAWSFSCSWLYGRIRAYRTEDYLVSSTPSKKVVVLRMYGDKVISVPYIRKDGKIHVKKEFMVFKLGDDAKIKFHSEKIKFLYQLLRD